MLLNAAAFEGIAAQVRADVQRRLIIDEMLDGFAEVHPDSRIAYWRHPRAGTPGGPSVCCR
jgi:hypothetical protein